MPEQLIKVLLQVDASVGAHAVMLAVRQQLAVWHPSALNIDEFFEDVIQERNFE